MKLKIVIPLLISIFIFIIALIMYIYKKPDNIQPLLYKTNNYKINVDIPDINYKLINDEIKKIVTEEQNKF